LSQRATLSTNWYNSQGCRRAYRRKGFGREPRLRAASSAHVSGPFAPPDTITTSAGRPAMRRSTVSRSVRRRAPTSAAWPTSGRRIATRLVRCLMPKWEEVARISQTTNPAHLDLLRATPCDCRNRLGCNSFSLFMARFTVPSSPLSPRRLHYISRRLQRSAG
jgi:hypothetical protein